jgi:hypothetical protein
MLLLAGFVFCFGGRTFSESFVVGAVFVKGIGIVLYQFGSCNKVAGASLTRQVRCVLHYIC